jgi:hypothetical protein
MDSLLLCGVLFCGLRPNYKIHQQIVQNTIQNLPSVTPNPSKIDHKSDKN